MKSKQRAVRGVVAVVLVCVMILSGCKAEEKQEPIEITLMHGWGGTLKTHNTMQQIYAEFSVQNPDISLQCIPYSDSSIAVSKANEMLAVGKMPDVIATNSLSYYVDNAVKRGMALDLMPYIEADARFAESIHPSVYETWTMPDGKLYTLPDVMETAGYWYNKEYFKQAEVTLPSTWEELFGVLERLQVWIDESMADVKISTLEHSRYAEMLFLARLAGENENGMLVAADGKQSITEDTLRPVMEDIGRLKTYFTEVDSIENARKDFYDGKTAVYFNGVWESDVLADSALSDVYGYANYPTASGASLSYISPSSGYVAAAQEDIRKEEAAIRFLKYMLSEEVQMKIAIETGQSPSSPKVNREKIIAGYPLFGMADNVVYCADLQIKTIFSVWSNEKRNILNSYMDKAEIAQEDIPTMVQELNHAK